MTGAEQGETGMEHGLMPGWPIAMQFSFLVGIGIAAYLLIKAPPTVTGLATAFGMAVVSMTVVFGATFGALLSYEAARGVRRAE